MSDILFLLCYLLFLSVRRNVSDIYLFCFFYNLEQIYNMYKIFLGKIDGTFRSRIV